MYKQIYQAREKAFFFIGVYMKIPKPNKNLEDEPTSN